MNAGVENVKSEEELANFTYDQLLRFAVNCRKSVPDRIRPSGMRMSRTHSAKIGDIELYVTIGFYANGEMAELFVSTDKEGTVVKGLLAALSKTISNMLQYNVPAKEISRLLRGQQFEPSGFVSRHPYIKSAASIADLLSKIIDIELGDFTRCQIKPDSFKRICENDIETSGILDNTGHEEDITEDVSDMDRIYGETCANCSSTRLYRNGTCKVCADCGSTTGCS